MKILSIGSDRNLFKEGSAVRERMRSYAEGIDEMHIIVFATKALGLKPQQIEGNIWLYPTNSRSRFAYPHDAIRIAREIEGVDVVTTQDPFEAGYAGWRVARRIKAGLHVQIHTDLFSPFFTKGSLLNRVRVMIARRVIPHADCLRVVGEHIVRSLRRSGITLKHAPVVLPIFVDVEKIWSHHPSFDLHARYPQFDEIVVMTSRLSPEKNIILALTAFAEVIKNHPEAGLIIVGDGPSRSQLQKEVRRKRLSENVIFESATNDVISYHKTADLFLLTSDFEGYGMTLVEAAAADCPIVTTDVGIARDFFGRTQSALICRVGDAMCLARSIKQLIAAPGGRQRLRLKAQQVIKNRVISDREEYLRQYRATWERCIVHHKK